VALATRVARALVRVASGGEIDANPVSALERRQCRLVEPELAADRPWIRPESGTKLRVREQPRQQIFAGLSRATHNDTPAESQTAASA